MEGGELQTSVVFPAYAGMIRWATSHSRNAPSVPRLRGDDPSSAVLWSCSVKCSPPTRG